MSRKPAKYDHAISSMYNTYACKEELKALPGGAYFEDGVWWVQEKDFAEATEIALRAGLRKRTKRADTPRQVREPRDWSEPDKSKGEELIYRTSHGRADKYVPGELVRLKRGGTYVWVVVLRSAGRWRVGEEDDTHEGEWRVGAIVRRATDAEITAVEKSRP